MGNKHSKTGTKAVRNHDDGTDDGISVHSTTSTAAMSVEEAMEGGRWKQQVSVLHHSGRFFFLDPSSWLGLAE